MSGRRSKRNEARDHPPRDRAGLRFQLLDYAVGVRHHGSHVNHEVHTAPAEEMGFREGDRSESTIGCSEDRVFIRLVVVADPEFGGGGESGLENAGNGALDGPGEFLRGGVTLFEKHRGDDPDIKRLESGDDNEEHHQHRDRATRRHRAEEPIEKRGAKELESERDANVDRDPARILPGLRIEHRLSEKPGRVRADDGDQVNEKRSSERAARSFGTDHKRSVQRGGNRHGGIRRWALSRDVRRNA